MKTRLYLATLIVLATTSAFAAESVESFPLFAKPMEYWRQHVLLANASHAAGGFGLAVVLQRHLAGKPAIKALGWLLLAFALVTHLIAFL
ncbi:MAG: hypothetical protein WAW39_24985 [Prosthecobacter sp.]|uniref:hypothetical protein n=1 Tax=Prosthecobacter sp. TaxID=1965333 RepID=UPI003BB11993